MPHALTELKLTAVTKPAADPGHEIRADVCVVGAGIAGLSAAIESAQLGRDVVLLDSLPVIGGQMVHSLIGLFCGVFGNAPRYAQLTHGVFDDIFRDLGPSGDLHFQRGHTTTVYYNEVALGRWLETQDPLARGADHPGHRPAAGGRARRPDRADLAGLALRQRLGHRGRLRRRQRRRGPDLGGRPSVLGPRAPDLRLTAGHRRGRGRAAQARPGRDGRPHRGPGR